MPQTRPLRTVRSFVSRNTKLPPPKEMLYETLGASYGLDQWRSIPLISPFTLFNRVAPVILEIGFGDGDSLFTMAKHHPNQDFIGIEVYRRGIVSLLSKLKDCPLTNLKLFCGDVQEILPRFEPASFDRVQIFFPDPWPKLRHHKRRLIQSKFVTELATFIKSDGILHLATDWQDYASHMMKVLSETDFFINTVPDQSFATRPEYRPKTKYEQRGIRLGHTTSDILFKRKA